MFESAFVIIAVILVLIFLGILFLATTLYYNNRKAQILKEQQLMKDAFEKQILQSRIEMQEQTLNFISQEIHDNVGQLLSLAKVQLNIMEQQEETEKPILKDAKDNIGKAMTELRDIARSLNSERIQSFNFTDALTDEINRINRGSRLKASVDFSGPCDRFKDQHKLILFRLIQESLQNILKHAKATQLQVHVCDDTDEFSIVIKDNGVGFDANAELNGNKGLGLKNITGRAALLGGRASIESAAGHGTTISITIPHA
jgi:two-component system, NarL family, sensor kinase